MYAVVVRERGQAHQINISGQRVQANVLPRAVQAPGIVSGLPVGTAACDLAKIQL